MLPQSDERSSDLFDDLDPVVRGLGYSIVELSAARRQGVFHVVLVIYRDDGVNVQACADIHRAIYPRLEVLHPDADIQLEVSSPGIYRNFKSPREFAIFAGCRVKLLLEGEGEWRKGIIGTSSGASVSLDSDGSVVEVEFAVIRKAKLDYP